MGNEDRSCWGCGFHQIGGSTLLGVCWGHFEERGALEIKATKGSRGYIVDYGCKNWTAEKQDFDKIKNGKGPISIIEEEL